jgi:hypothetical protein
MVPLKKFNNPGTEMDGKFQRIFKRKNEKNAEFHASSNQWKNLKKTFYEKNVMGLQ